MLDADAINAIADLARAGRAAQMTQINPDHSLAYLDAEGRTVFREGRLPPKQHAAMDLESFLAVSIHRQAVEVWVADEHVKAIFPDRREFCVFTIKPSVPILHLRNFADSPQAAWHDQKGAAHLLRTVFFNCLPPGSDLAKNLCDLEWETGETSQQAVRFAEASMSSKIIAKVKSIVGDIPNDVTFTVPVFSVPICSAHAVDHCKIDVQCVLQLDPTSRKMRFTPVNGAIETAKHYARTCIKNCLAELQTAAKSSIPVFAGSP